MVEEIWGIQLKSSDRKCENTNLSGAEVRILVFIIKSFYIPELLCPCPGKWGYCYLSSKAMHDPRRCLHLLLHLLWPPISLSTLQMVAVPCLTLFQLYSHGFLFLKYPPHFCPGSFPLTFQDSAPRSPPPGRLPSLISPSPECLLHFLTVTPIWHSTRTVVHGNLFLFSSLVFSSRTLSSLSHPHTPNTHAYKWTSINSKGM